MRAINWFALAAGILALLLAAASQMVPWWQVAVGSVLTVGLSPVKVSISILGLSLDIPVITLINIIFTLLLVAPGIVLILYSVFPTKPYAKHMLGFAYKKPLAVFIVFLVILLLLASAGSLLAATLFRGYPGALSNLISSFNMPLWGTRTILIPNVGSMFGFSAGYGTPSVNISLPISGNLQWTFWLAAIVATLCIAARIYSRKFVPVKETVATEIPAPPAPPPPPPPPPETTEKPTVEQPSETKPEEPSA
jgi:hypothetical protein